MAPMGKEIPDDVAFSILSRLPMKSLKRFICIRKSFALLLENPQFMTMFSTNFISKIYSFYDDTSLLLLQSDPNVLYLLSGERFQNKVKLEWPPPFQEDSRYLSILGFGIHDTLCLNQGGKVVLWNPATKEFNIIPRSPIESLPYMDFVIWQHGFGYDYVTNDYKVIRKVEFLQYLTDFEGDGGYENIPSSPEPLWEIYSLRSNSWRTLDIDMCVDCGREGIHMNGVCHWLCGPNESSGEACLVSFKFSNESSYTTTLPMDLCDDLVQNDLVVLNGPIAVISRYPKMTSFHISILGELGVKESWTKLFIIGPLSCVEHPIGTGKKCGIFFRKKDGEAAWFDLSGLVVYKENLLRFNK